AVGAPRDGEVPGDGDADLPVGVVGDQWRVLESVDLPRPDPSVARAVVDVDQFGPGLAVEDLEAVGGGDDHILVAVAAEIGGAYRADDGTDRRHLPQHGA